MRPYYEQNGILIYHGDCRDILPELSVGVTAVITDPPYVFGLASSGSEMSKVGGWGDLMNASVWYESWLSEVKRLTENLSGSAWVFNSWRSFPVLARASTSLRWPIESLMVWDKIWLGAGGQRGLRPSYELVALFCHADFQISNRSLPDIWRCHWSSYKPHHPAEKPVALLSKIIHCSGPGSVLDPFSGSGSTLVAAKSQGCPAIGIEIEERHCETAARRLEQEILSLEGAIEVA